MRMLQAPLFVCSSPLAGGYKPPKLGGWGSEQPNSMYNTDNVLPFSVLYITLFSLLSCDGEQWRSRFTTTVCAIVQTPSPLT